VARITAHIRPGVRGYDVDEDAILFLEYSGELLRLNPTAALVWRGLASGLSSREIIDSLAQVLKAPATNVERDVTGLINSLQEAGALVLNRE
jgi:coenzyme PQQ synthesis protein D (PqqD)